MGGFAGVVRFDRAPVDRRTEEQLARALSKNAGARIRRSGSALFAHFAEDDSPVADTARRHGATDEHDILFAANCRLDNRDELGAALQIPSSKLALTPDTSLLKKMFERWGEAGIARCLGCFAFAHWQANARRLVLGRDYIGRRALFFHRGDGFVVFANSLAALLALPFVPRQIDEIALANFMAVNYRDTRKTVYRGIERVPTRTLVTIDPKGARHEYYWSPNLDATPPYRREEDYIARARELFDQAVATASSGAAHIAISTSGGLDSSAVAATAARLGRSERITCYTLLPPADLELDGGPHRYLSEQSKVLALGRMYPELELRFLTPETPHPMEDDTRFFLEIPQPRHAIQNFGWFSFLDDAVAAAGHKFLLVGTRGNDGLTWTGKFSLLALLCAGEYATFAKELMAVAREEKSGAARTLYREVMMPGVPASLRRSIHRMRGRGPDSVAWYSALNPAFIAEHGLARQWHEQGFDPLFETSGWNPARHRAFRIFDLNQATRDQLAMYYDEHYGFELRDPHTDRRLLEFLLSVPEPFYRRNGVPRSFARAVFADRLPREILDNRQRGMQGGAWFRRLNMMRQAIADDIERLEASATTRRLVDVPGLKRLLDRWPADDNEAEARSWEYRYLLPRALQIGHFIRWVEGGNA